MTLRETGLLSSSSGANRNVIGNFVRQGNPAERRDTEHQPSLHVVNAWPVDPVALATVGELAGQCADRMHGIHVAQHQNAWLVARRITAHEQNVAKRISG